MDFTSLPETLKETIALLGNNYAQIKIVLLDYLQMIAKLNITIGYICLVISVLCIIGLIVVCKFLDRIDVDLQQIIIFISLAGTVLTLIVGVYSIINGLYVSYLIENHPNVAIIKLLTNY